MLSVIDNGLIIATVHQHSLLINIIWSQKQTETNFRSFKQNRRPCSY
jgi:hypothetical protein